MFNEALLKKLKKSSTVRRIAFGGFWSVFGVVSEKAISLASIVFVVRLLGKESYGLFAILQSTLAMAGVFAALGLGTTATKHVAELKFSNPERLGRILTMTRRLSYGAGFLLLILLALGSPFICGHILHQPELVRILPFAAIAVVLNTIDGYQSGVLLGFEAVRKTALAYLAAAFISAPVFIVLTYWQGLNGAVVGLICVAAMRYIVSSFILKECLNNAGIQLGVSDWRQEWTVFRNFALPSFLSGLAITPAHWICHTMLINSVGGKGEMAVLGIANQWYFSVLFIPMAAGRILLPVLTDLASNSSMKNSNRVVLLTVMANLIIMLPAVIVLGILSPWIMTFYGHEYVSHSGVLVAMVAAAGSYSICMPIGHMLTVSNKMWAGFTLNIFWGVTYVAISFLLLDKGALGVALALLSAYLFHGFTSFIMAWLVVLRKKSA